MAKSKVSIINIKNQALPRLTIFRSNKYIYAQVVALDGSVVASASSLKMKEPKLVVAGEKVGAEIAKLAIAKGADKVVFDRSKYRYFGAVKSLAEAARAAGLKF